MECFRGFSLRLRPRGPTTSLDPSPTIPSLVELFVPMHRARGRLVAPPADPMQRSRKSLLVSGGKKSLRGRTPAGAPATPEAASRSGVRHSPRLSAASASAAAAAAAVSAARYMDESQPLLSPPACLVAKSCTCDWSQAIQCALPHVEPEPCQRQGCGILVHHLCQGEWERREGYGDTVARLCCLHHPDYKYRSAPEKADAGVEDAQAIISKAKVVNIASQLTTEGAEDLSSEDSEEVSEGGGDDDDDDYAEPKSGGGGGWEAVIKTAFSSLCMKSLITRRISMMFMSVRLTTWSAVQSQRPTALLSKRFTWSKR